MPHPEDTRTALALTAQARDYIDHLRGAWRRGDPNELIDAVTPIGSFVGQQATDVLVGETVLAGLTKLAEAPTYANAAIQRWQDANTIQKMQDTLPSAAVQTDLLSAQERSKSNFENLETAYQTRRALDDAELGGAANGAGLSARHDRDRAPVDDRQPQPGHGPDTQ